MVAVMVEEIEGEYEDELSGPVAETTTTPTEGEDDDEVIVDRFRGVDFASDKAYEYARDDTRLDVGSFGGHGGTGEDGAFTLDDVIALNEDGWPAESEFSSGHAYRAWVESGKASLVGVARTGHGGKTFSKKDVSGAR